MYQQVTIKTLHQQGEKKSKIASLLGCHRHTVTNVIKRETIIEKQTRIKSSVFDPYKEKIKEWLDGEISRLRICEKLDEEYKLKSTYINLCKYVEKQFPKKVEAFGVQQTESGEVAEIDFGELGMFPREPGGKRVRTFALAVVLPYSRLIFFAICYDQKLETLLKELTNAFYFFCGVPKRLKVDNMRTAILKNQHYDLILNPDFLEFTKHMGTVIIPCTPYSPEQKGTVESGIKYIQGNFIAGRTFTDETDMKRQLQAWMEGYANKRIHGTTKKVPLTVFTQEEMEKLQSLPSEDFAFFNRCVRKVAKNCHIHFENNYYSVPSSLVGEEVTVRWNEHLLRIIYKGEQKALHYVNTGLGNYVTVRNHLPDYKVYSEKEYQTRYETKMASLGKEAHDYFIMLLATKESYWFQTVRVILGLSKQYGNETVNLALKRALYYKVTDVMKIRNILEKKLYLKDAEPILLQEKTEDESMCRDLTYYTLR